MKYDITKPMLDAKGAQFKDTEPLTMKVAIERVLLSDQAGGPGQTVQPDDKNRRFKLWRKVVGCEGELDVTVEEVNTIKGAAHILSTIFYGQLMEFLDGGA